MGFLIFMGVVVSSAWVYSDAKSRNSSCPGMWAIGVFLLWIIFFPMYLIGRPMKTNTAVNERRSQLCPHCGKYFEPPVTFCPHCGTRI